MQTECEWSSEEEDVGDIRDFLRHCVSPGHDPHPSLIPWGGSVYGRVPWSWLCRAHWLCRVLPPCPSPRPLLHRCRTSAVPEAWHKLPLFRVSTSILEFLGPLVITLGPWEPLLLIPACLQSSIPGGVCGDDCRF